MGRRRYEMGRRAEAVERTRSRILEATMEVHDEQGIVAGRWPDIAERAGVSLATVYRHFPTLEDLATACGELTMRVVDPPTPDDAPARFAGTDDPAERIERLVRECFDFYERAGRMTDNVRRDRRRLPALEEGHALLEAGLAALAEEALRPLGPDDDARALARAMTDVRVWEALRERGLGPEEAVEAATRMLVAAVIPGDRGSTRRPRRRS